MNPLLEFGKKIKEALKGTLTEPNWITATETEITLWFEEPSFNSHPIENEDFEWYGTSSSPDYCGEFIMTFPMFNKIREFYNIKEYQDADSNDDYFRQFKICKEYIGD